MIFKELRDPPQNFLDALLFSLIRMQNFQERFIGLRLMFKPFLDGRDVGDGVVELYRLPRWFFRLSSWSSSRSSRPRRRRRRLLPARHGVDLAPELLPQVFRHFDLVALGQEGVEAINELAVALE